MRAPLVFSVLLVGLSLMAILFIGGLANNVSAQVSQVDYVSPAFPAKTAISQAGLNCTDSRDARFFTPKGMKADALGNIWIADVENNRIREYTAEGAVKTIAGTGLPGNQNGSIFTATFDHPSDIAIAPDGTIYVADTLNHSIRVIARRTVTTLAGGNTGGGVPCPGINNSTCKDGTGSAAQFNYPLGIALDAEGNIIVSDTGNRRIRKVTPSGVVTTLAGNGSTLTISENLTPALSASIGPPKFIVFSPVDNSFYFTQGNALGWLVQDQYGVWQYNRLAGVFNSPGLANGLGATARFNDPQQLVMRAYENEVGSYTQLAVADRGNNLIRMVTLGGSAFVLAGKQNPNGSPVSGFVDGTAVNCSDPSGSGYDCSAAFNSPVGIAVDPRDMHTMFVSESYSRSIRRVSPGMIVSSVAGYTPTSCPNGACGGDYRDCLSGSTHASCVMAHYCEIVPGSGPALCTDNSSCSCGNGICSAFESYGTCPQDCTCGNNVCDAGETANSCAIDCVSCGDGICSVGEQGVCALDCGNATVTVFDTPVDFNHPPAHPTFRAVTCSDESCTSGATDLLSLPGTQAEVAVNSAGNPLFLYTDSSEGSMFFTSCSDAQCTSHLTVPIQGGAFLQSKAIGVADQDRPILLYYENGPQNLYYILCDEPSCNSHLPPVIVEETASAGDVFQLRLRQTGSGVQALIGWYRSGNQLLSLVYCDSEMCQSSVENSVVPDGVQRGEYDFQLDGQSIPLFVYLTDNDGLRLARCANQLCDGSPTILSFPVSARHPRLIRLSGGRPGIVYQDAATFGLRLIACADIACDPATATISSITTAAPLQGDLRAFVSSTRLPMITFFEDPTPTQAYNFDAIPRVLRCLNESCTQRTISPGLATDALPLWVSTAKYP